MNGAREAVFNRHDAAIGLAARDGFKYLVKCPKGARLDRWPEHASRGYLAESSAFALVGRFYMAVSVIVCHRIDSKKLEARSLGRKERASVNLALLSDLPARASRSFVEAKAKVKEAKEGRAGRWAHDCRVVGDGVYQFLRAVS